jgi:hypothetical protein
MHVKFLCIHCYFKPIELFLRVYKCSNCYFKPAYAKYLKLKSEFSVNLDKIKISAPKMGAIGAADTA